MSQESDNDSENVGYMEFTFPYTYEDEDELSYVVIDFNVTEWFRERYVDGYDEYPPASEDACTALAQHFEKNHSFYFSNGLIRDAMDHDHGISSPRDLKDALDADKMRFIY